MVMDAGTNDLNIEMFDTPLKAPNYTKPEYKGANLTTARVVGMGTIGGAPTVDFVFEDESGQKYIAMLTGALIENLSGAVQGMKLRTADHPRKDYSGPMGQSL